MFKVIRKINLTKFNLKILLNLIDNLLVYWFKIAIYYFLLI
jgi:hypothetical protein